MGVASEIDGDGAGVGFADGTAEGEGFGDACIDGEAAGVADADGAKISVGSAVPDVAACARLSIRTSWRTTSDHARVLRKNLIAAASDGVVSDGFQLSANENANVSRALGSWAESTGATIRSALFGSLARLRSRRYQPKTGSSSAKNTVAVGEIISCARQHSAGVSIVVAASPANKFIFVAHRAAPVDGA